MRKYGLVDKYLRFIPGLIRKGSSTKSLMVQNSFFLSQLHLRHYWRPHRKPFLNETNCNKNVIFMAAAFSAAFRFLIKRRLRTKLESFETFLWLLVMRWQLCKHRFFFQVQAIAILKYFAISKGNKKNLFLSLLSLLFIPFLFFSYIHHYYLSLLSLFSIFLGANPIFTFSKRRIPGPFLSEKVSERIYPKRKINRVY